MQRVRSGSAREWRWSKGKEAGTGAAVTALQGQTGAAAMTAGGKDCERSAQAHSPVARQAPPEGRAAPWAAFRQQQAPGRPVTGQSCAGAERRAAQERSAAQARTFAGIRAMENMASTAVAIQPRRSRFNKVKGMG